MITFDTETCGLTGPIVLLQYAIDDGEVQLVSVWKHTVGEVMELIEMIANHPGGVVGFNLAFDWFHMCQMYTTLALLPDKDAILEDIIEEYAEFEIIARDGPCLKPVKACDVMLIARKGPYQSTMDRGDIRIKKVPTAIAWQLAAELENRVPLKDIYFARRKTKNLPKWQIFDIEDSEGDIDPNFKDIVVKFSPSAALKALAVDALGVNQDELLLYGDIDVDKTWYPEEYGYAPFAKAVGSRHDWKGAWPEKIAHHISHWAYHRLARIYATKDVVYTRDLYKHFGSPELGDDDSELACMVGAVRWKGFKIDVQKIEALKIKAIEKLRDIPIAPAQVRYYVTELMSPEEKLVLKGSTKKVILESVATLKQPCSCNPDPEIDFSELGEVDEELFGDISPDAIVGTVKPIVTNCDKCKNTGWVRHPAAIRAEEVLNARKSKKKIELYDKLLKAGRFHASLKVIGALSGRMSGSDGLNAQGIDKTEEVRSCFPLTFSNNILCGGDFAGFEVTIAEAVYGDSKLREALLTCEKCDGQMQWIIEKTDFICQKCGSRDGKAIHALFGVHVYPEHNYHSLKKTKGTSDDKYTRAKSGIFSMFYGGTDFTLQDRLGVPIDVAIAALKAFHREFPGVKRAQVEVENAFQSMRQPNGIGTRVEWHDPADYRETIFGFRRYFTLENMITKALYDLANNTPKSWKSIKIRVMRRDREQTAFGATQSALYAAAFALQSSNVRAAKNHDIQSAGATITKIVQRKIWDIQPHGVNEWQVQPLNIHDEIMCPTHPNTTEKLKKVVNETVESIRPKVPLIKMDWITGLNSWADK